MKVVVAPGQLAGVLSASEAARAMAQGWRLQRPGDQLALVPMASGGEDTIEVVESAVQGARRRQIEVADARGRAIHAEWLSLPDGRALVEAAQACGLARLALGERDPLLATSYGVGQLIAAAAEGHREIMVGVAGTATVDGGGGMATALGFRLRRADGNSLKVGGRFLVDLDRVEAVPPFSAMVVVYSDATLPLLGPSGAVAASAVAKGATEQDLAL
ncbi:MAG: glycerate kinase, partial [Egibacteraceae bacterium]